MEPKDYELTIQRVVLNHMDPTQTLVFLFGSRASGEASPTSDYDVGLFKGKKIPFATLAKIKDELDDYPIPVDVDFVDFALTNESFKEIALRNIKIWNKPKKNLKLI